MDTAVPLSESHELSGLSPHEAWWNMMSTKCGLEFLQGTS
jgi:hypothetical protein